MEKTPDQINHEDSCYTVFMSYLKAMHMNQKEAKLTQLRKDAEAALHKDAEKSSMPRDKVDEANHELNVYRIELEMQVEELQLANEATQAAQKRYANLFDFAPVGLIVTDANGIVSITNHTAMSMLQCERRDIENEPFAEFIIGDDKDLYHIHRRAVLSSSSVQNCEVRLMRADGSSFHAQLTTDLPDDNDDTLRTAITDISSIKEAEKALRQSLEYQYELNRLQARIISVVEHEFRTPLTVILASVELIERYDDKLTPERKHQLYQTVHNFVWYLNNTVQDVQVLQPVDQAITYKPHEFDLTRFVSQIAVDMSAMAKDGQSIKLDIDPTHDHDIVNWDENLLRRILMNTLNNAVKYSSEDVILKVDFEEDLIRFQISDQGIGISEQDMPHIYEAFYRGLNVDFIPGTGIGLYIVRKATEAQGGSIRCESRLGAGTSFIIEIPRWPAQP